MKFPNVRTPFISLISFVSLIEGTAATSDLELETSAAGLGGHLYDFWRFVADSSWIGGDTEYSVLNEAMPYWVNAIVPLSYTLNDERLKGQVHHVVDTILDRIQPDGWIGPETLSGGERMIWARTLLFLGLTNLADANSTYEMPIVNAMHRFNTLMNSMLRKNGTGMIYHEGDKLSADDYLWFRSRAEDMIVSLQWMIDYHPGDQIEVLKENIELLHKFAFKWEGWYTEGSYIKEDLYDLPESITDDQWAFLHGVTIAEGNQSFRNLSTFYVDWTFEYHGSASGTILADERIDGLNAYYGSELCTDVETIYSLAYNYFAIGDADYADRAELAAFNALPAAVSGDWWSHQYMTEPNQPFSKNLSATPFFDVNTQGQTFGLEPDYPCCTVNHPQGYPKFTMYSYLRNGKTGIVHALLSPGRVETTIQRKAVSIDCQTQYPFSNLLSYEIDSDVEFQFYIRVPGWATGVSIRGSGQEDYTTVPDRYSRLIQVEVPSGKTSFDYEISMALRVEQRANDTVAVYQGSLLYAFHVPHTVVSGPPKFYNNQTNYPPGTFPRQAHDHALLNTTEWNLAIDPSTLVYHAGSGDLPSPTFEDGKLPAFVTAKACLIEWPLFAGVVPGSPIPLSERKCLGNVFEAVLRPYGSAKLHMSDLPIIDLSEK
ncbi:hypothetical protein N7462_000861 [Penicillium macrosclerotiorum]|uniref:uncharacterized protein n=1 Tax=Penicillium macrosclerotiorum TaxID=303699 RepID=UPI002547D640|nr:uncharacterized protein N7462_000861 [Penicillium macrosclerotiorum]KAJ5698856.1 hypothetical protein N7462_000861 [Penicillium macrosclerotiorum]